METTPPPTPTPLPTATESAEPEPGVPAVSEVAEAVSEAVPDTYPEFYGPPRDETGPVLRRIRRTSVVAYVVFALFLLPLGGWRALVGLTCSAVVTMINFLWLEEIVEAVLQPSPRLKAWRLSLRTLGRFALLGVALSVAIFVARFNAVSVLLGFSIVVVGIMGEALYSVFSYKSS